MNGLEDSERGSSRELVSRKVSRAESMMSVSSAGSVNDMMSVSSPDIRKSPVYNNRRIRSSLSREYKYPVERTSSYDFSVESLTSTSTYPHHRNSMPTRPLSGNERKYVKTSNAYENLSYARKPFAETNRNL